MSTNDSAINDPSVQAVLKAKDETIEALKNKSGTPQTVMIKPYPFWKTTIGKVFIVAFVIVFLIVLLNVVLAFAKNAR
ncbi:MAG: hypothetical protein WCO33_01340 [bacterium]